jgi:tRNA(Ile)-lysidine synthase
MSESIVRQTQEEDEKRTRVSRFARGLLAEWRRLELPVGEWRGVVAVSGGADSTALLLACEELVRAKLWHVELSAAHLDHGLRGAAGAEDARWVEGLARELGLKCALGHASVRERAADAGDNLEQAARRARYEFLRETARASGAHAVLTAHTLDDQAETVLLRLLRGSGAEGLAGIPTVRRLEADAETPLLVRTLVRWARRAETEAYCIERGAKWRDDEMNADEKFARVRVRKILLPLVETFNPRAVEALGRTSELLSEDSAALEAAACKLLNEATRDEGATLQAGDAYDGDDNDTSRPRKYLNPPPPLSVRVLARAPKALRRRALRLWVARGRGDLRRVELVHVEALEKLLAGERGGRVAELPGGGSVERRRGCLMFREASREKELKKD